MSGKSEAKKQQGYRTRPNSCSNCIHYSSDMIEDDFPAICAALVAHISSVAEPQVA